MSSLRISHQNRAIAPPAGGDTGRAEHADDAGFALALGAAAGGAAKDAWVAPGGQIGDSPGSRKRDNSQTKDSDAAAVAAGVAGSLVATAAANSGAGIAGAADETALPDVGPLTAGAKGSGAGARSDRSATLAGTPGTPPSAVVLAATTTDAPNAAGSLSASNPALPGQGQSDQKLETALAAPNGDLAAAGSPDIATFGAIADAAGVPALPAPGAPAGPRLETARGSTDLPSGTLLSLASVDMGQSAMADGGSAFASTTRDHFSPIAPTTDAGDAAAAAASTPAAAGSSPALSASAAAPGLAPDPAGAGSMADQIAGHMARMLSNGTREVTLRLHPPELGDLTMRVAVNGRDVSAWFASPQPQVQVAISAALGQLQTNLGGAGYNLTGAWVGGDGSGARQQSWSSSPAPSQVGASLAVAATAPAAAGPRPASGLNIYV